jgi:hypothetical protein
MLANRELGTYEGVPAGAPEAQSVASTHGPIHTQDGPGGRRTSEDQAILQGAPTSAHMVVTFGH